MNRNYYKDYYAFEREHWWFRARYGIIMSHLKAIGLPEKPIKILNIGAATGLSSILLQQFGQVKSVEYDEECCRFTKEELKIDIVNASITELPFEDDTFDLVCAFDVIEHVENEQLAVEEMKRVCKPGGIICLTVPAFMFLWSQHDEINHHFRRYTRRKLLKPFKQDGKVLFSSYFNCWLFFPIAIFRVISTLFIDKKQQEQQPQSDFGKLKFKGLQNLLYRIFHSENFFISRKISLPVGVSILMSWRKE